MKYYAVDIETTGLNPRKDKIVGVAVYDGEQGKYFEDFKSLKPFLENTSTAKIFHNAPFDVLFLKLNGIEVGGEIHDTMILSHLHDPDKESNGLKALSKQLLDSDSIKYAEELYQWLAEHKLTKRDIHCAPKELLTEYALEDVRNTYKLFQVFCEKHREIAQWLKSKGYEKSPWDYYKEEMLPMLPVLIDMEYRGVGIDLVKTAQEKERLIQEIKRIEEYLTDINKEYIKTIEEEIWQDKIEFKKKKNKSGQIKKLPPRVVFNWSSNDHLKVLFFRKLKMPTSKVTEKGNVAIDSEVLETFVEKLPWVEELLKLKTYNKLVSTYLENLLELQENCHIFAKFNIIGTVTGRFSCSDPNLQNLPKVGNIKSLFVPKPGHVFINADYSQLEYRIAAHESEDALMLAGYNNNKDFHTLTAEILGVTRDLAKTINFAIIYNASGFRVADILGYYQGIPKCSKKEKDWNCECDPCVQTKKAMKKGDQIIETLFSQYEGFREYLKKQKSEMLNSQLVYSRFGKVKRLRKIKSDIRKERNKEFKEGFNFPIQSFGSSLTKRAMIELYKKGYKIVNQVHDSIVIEVPETEVAKSEQELIKTMENIYKLKVPLKVETKILRSFQEVK